MFLAPNDPKLSDGGVRRGTCTVGGKAEAEAGAVTHGAVRCSAGLGVTVVGAEALITLRPETRIRRAWRTGVRCARLK